MISLLTSSAPDEASTRLTDRGRVVRIHSRDEYHLYVRNLGTDSMFVLQEQWEAHRLLAQRFTPGGTVEFTAEQLETLRSLGYIR